jgi:6-phosphogluconolactonase/glucosamine-6-phosphate isomerase/deaminase
MEIIHTDNPAENAGMALIALLIKYQNKPILLLLSGGSSLSLIDEVDTNFIGKNVTLGIVDERCTKNEADRNFTKLAATDFFKSAIANGASVLSPNILPCSEAGNVATDWSSQLRNWFLTNPDGICIATLGIGPDGHIAGMFPGEWPVDFFGSDLVVSYSVPKEVNPFTNRLTITNTFLLEKVDHAIVYVVGQEKAPILKIIEEKSDSLEKIPAQILYQMKSTVLFTDQ